MILICLDTNPLTYLLTYLITYTHSPTKLQVDKTCAKTCRVISTTCLGRAPSGPNSQRPPRYHP